MVEVKIGSELASLLRKALAIEEVFESASQMNGYVDLRKDDLRDLILDLASESAEHRRLVETLISMIGDDARSGADRSDGGALDFQDKNEVEMLMELAKYAKLAYDTYLKIREALYRSDLRLFMKEQDIPFFVTSLERLIAEKAEQSDRVAKLVGRAQMTR